MNLVNQSFKIIEQDDVMKHVELCGRVSTMSFDKMNENSHKNFSKRLENANHGSVLEHGSIYLQFPNKQSIPSKILESPYSDLRRGGEKESGDYYLYTNLRVLFDNDKEFYNKVKEALLESKKFVDENIKFFEPSEDDQFKRVTIEIITYKQIETETVRHRTGSYTINSTRFINFFKTGVSFVDVSKWLVNNKSILLYKLMCKLSEFAYRKLLKWGNQRQFAASVLLYSHKSDMFMTMSIEKWKMFFNLRCSGKGAHPAIAEISDGIREEFLNRGYIK